MAERSSEDNRSKSVALTPSSSSTDNQLSRCDTPAVEATSSGREREAKRSIIQRIRGSFSILGHLFYRASKDDFEKRLQHLSKEEAAAHTRLKRRSQAWRKLARGVIVYSIIIELLTLGVAVVTTRALELTWQMRAVRVLPVFAFPALASLMYSTCASYYRMCERKDQKTLERLRNERQAKIDELKERTNYYLTQQLIHKYDSDPAAKEAAARVLASKLGTEAGLSLAFGPSTVDEANKLGLTERRNQGVEVPETTGLRRRVKQDSLSASQPLPLSSQQLIMNEQSELREQAMELDQFAGKPSGGGWVARLAAMLVGEDPTQCYALICRNCHMHNGLARKEDFQYITYYCPHCQSLNGSRQLGETGEGSGSQAPTSLGDATSALQAASNLALADALLTGEGSDSDHLTSSLQEASADSTIR